MYEFHMHIASLELSSCAKCSEGFPGLKVHSQSAECVRCSRDQHVPKLYSSRNNMDPGPVPPQLIASKDYSCNIKQAAFVTKIIAFSEGNNKLQNNNHNDTNHSTFAEVFNNVRCVLVINVLVNFEGHH